MSENQIYINFKYFLGDNFNKVTEKEKKRRRRRKGRERKEWALETNKHRSESSTSEASISETSGLFTCTQMPALQSSWEKLQSPTSTTPRPNEHQDVGGSDGKEGRVLLLLENNQNLQKASH